jgi:hypothetical protein
MNVTYMEIVRNLFTVTTRNPVSSSLNKYFSSVKALETYDYFTYQKLESSDITIRNSEDVVRVIFNNYITSCNYLCGLDFV